MKLRFLAAATLAALTLTAGLASAQDTSSEKGKLSYALGYQLGREAVESGESLDLNTMVKALQDGYAKKDPAVQVEQMRDDRSEEHTSELQSLMRNSYAVFCLKNKQN